MKNLTLTKDFFLGGRAIFTVHNTETGEHRTFKIKKTKPNDRYPIPSWLALQMTGCDNENHYSYIGKIHIKAGQDQRGNTVPVGFVELTANSRFKDENHPTVKVTRWVMDRVINNRPIPDCIEIEHAGHCGRCGRLLTHPTSISIGIGPECIKHVGDW